MFAELLHKEISLLLVISKVSVNGEGLESKLRTLNKFVSHKLLQNKLLREIYLPYE